MATRGSWPMKGRQGARSPMPLIRPFASASSDSRSDSPSRRVPGACKRRCGCQLFGRRANNGRSAIDPRPAPSNGAAASWRSARRHRSRDFEKSTFPWSRRLGSRHYVGSSGTDAFVAARCRDGVPQTGSRARSGSSRGEIGRKLCSRERRYLAGEVDRPPEASRDLHGMPVAKDALG